MPINASATLRSVLCKLNFARVTRKPQRLRPRSSRDKPPPRPLRPLSRKDPVYIEAMQYPKVSDRFWEIV